LIPPAWIAHVGEWVIGRSRVIGVDIVDLVTTILDKWTFDLTIHIKMISRCAYCTWWGSGTWTNRINILSF